MEAAATFYNPQKPLWGEFHPGGDTTKVHRGHQCRQNKHTLVVTSVTQVSADTVQHHQHTFELDMSGFLVSFSTATAGSRPFWKRRLLLGLGT